MHAYIYIYLYGWDLEHFRKPELQLFKYVHNNAITHFCCISSISEAIYVDKALIWGKGLCPAQQ